MSDQIDSLLANLGKAVRNHQTNQLKIMERAEDLYGKPLPQVAQQRRAMAELAGVDDIKLAMATISLMANPDVGANFFPTLTLQ